jgi:hypothetical protein
MTRGSVRSHLSLKMRFRAAGHVATPEHTSVTRRGPKPYAHGSARAHLRREARSGAIEHVAMRGYTSYYLS